MIWIRADANNKIGSGHVMRCMSIADALTECGEQVLFVVADGDSSRLLKDRGYESIVLNTAYENMESELPILEDIAGDRPPKVCLVDSYFVTEKYLLELRKITNTAYIDDVRAFDYPVDLLINYNIYGEELLYNRAGRTLLGTGYMPLRKEFAGNVRTAVRAEVRDVMITTGGSDKYNLAGRLLEMLMRDSLFSKLRYHVISGMYNQYYEYLVSLQDRYNNIHLYRNVSNMCELMDMCDVAITAGGSTMYELSSRGIPIICFSFVDNQEKIVSTFSKKEYVIYGGNYLVDKDGMFEDIKGSLMRLCDDRDARAEYCEKGKKLVDGLGALRIAGELIAVCKYGK